MDGFDRWASENGLPATAQVDGDEVVATHALLVETDRQDPCCFRRALVGYFASEQEAQAKAADVYWTAAFRNVGGGMVVVPAAEIGQVLRNGHVRFVSEGTVTER